MTVRVVETSTKYQDIPPCKTAAEMTQLCCEKTAALQCCEEVVKDWPGYTSKEIIDHLGLVLDDQGRDKDGRYVNIQMQPRKNPCGEQITKYDTSQKNCCDGVAALAWNMTVTPDVLPHDRSIIIAWTGSDGRQVEVVTTSNATWFSGGRKTAIGHGNSIELFAGPTFCGATAATVRDGCSEATVVIRSDLGQWLDRGPICGGLSGSPTYLSGIYTLISGKYKQTETITQYGWVVNGLYCHIGAGSSALCFEPGALTCDEIYCREVLARRPAGAFVETCLNINLVEALFGFYGNPINCITSDGTIIARHGSYSDSMNCPNTSGSNELHGGFYAKTNAKHFYEWSC